MSFRDVFKRHAGSSNPNVDTSKVVDHIRSKYGEKEANDVQEALDEYFSDSPDDDGSSSEESSGGQGQKKGRQKQGKGKGGKGGKGAQGGRGSSKSPGSGMSGSDEGASATQLIAKMFPGLNQIKDGEPVSFYEEDKETRPLDDDKLEEGNVDEWDYHAQAYTRRTTYKIMPYARDSSDSDYEKFQDNFGHLVGMIKSELSKLKKRKTETVKGLKKGTRISPGKAVLEVTRVAAGKEPTGEIYTKKKELERDYTVGILIDRSGSTCRGASGSDYSRIQVEKYSALLIAEALEEIGDEFSIHSFSTTDDGNITYLEELKSPQEPLGVEQEKKICSLGPGEQNRDGAAIRGMIKELKKRKSKNKVLFLISDGQPAVDGHFYAGDYGLEDTSKAIEEAEKDGIRVVYLSIDPQPDYFRKISQHASFAKAYADVEELPQEITNIYKSLTKLTK